MKKVGIFGQSFKKEDAPYFKTLIEKLRTCGVEIVLDRNFLNVLSGLDFEDLDFSTFTQHRDLDNTFDLLFTFGGDGTILSAVTLVRDLNIPILGINTGRLGFLATVRKEEIERTIDSLMARKYSIQKRALLNIQTNQGNEPFANLNYALNEVTIARKNSTSMIGVEAYLNGEHLTTYWADGLVIATPTGSTGYSLSCHGPIIIPESHNFVMTPIAPHNLSARPLVIPDKTNIRLKIIGREKDFFLSLDSRVSSVAFNTEITLTKAPFCIQIVQLDQQTFIQTLRSKLLWGEDKRNYM
jgi:NAD+ kinase